MAMTLEQAELGLKSSTARWDASVRRGLPNPILYRNMLLNRAQVDALRTGGVVPKYDAAWAQQADAIGRSAAFQEFSAQARTAPPPPHPDASNLSLGPNLGGEDAVTRPSDLPPGTGPGSPSGAGGLLLLAGGAALLFILLKKK